MHFTIKIISDNVCPWCYIGKARLDKAIALYQRVYPGGKDDTFAITWAPFYLDPTSPKKGVPWAEHVAQKFGPERIPPVQARLRSIGEQEGIDFNFDSRIGNTRDSHRLIELAKVKAAEKSHPTLESDVVGALMKAYFEDGGDITSHEMLVEAGVRGGLEDRAEVAEWLAGDGGGGAVDRHVGEAAALGVSGVPHFVIQGKYQIGGAQDAPEFMQQFVAIKEGTA